MSGHRTFRPAEAADVRRLRKTLLAAHVFADDAELDATWEAAPWRIQVNERGDVAVLARWRDGLDILAVEALWCPERAIADAMRQIRALAFDRGFGDVLAPPTPVAQLPAYEAAGMHAFETATTFVRKGLRAASPDLTATGGVVLRSATDADVRSVLEVDFRSFDEFWRYDARHIERFLTSQRLIVATSGSAVIGYTLSTVRAGDGLLGRIAVVPEWRRRGLGMHLVGDALAELRERGCDRVSLCTQTGNEAARALYAASGFEDTGQRFAFMRFG